MGTNRPHDTPDGPQRPTASADSASMYYQEGPGGSQSSHHITPSNSRHRERLQLDFPRTSWADLRATFGLRILVSLAGHAPVSDLQRRAVRGFRRIPTRITSNGTARQSATKYTTASGQVNRKHRRPALLAQADYSSIDLRDMLRRSMAATTFMSTRENLLTSAASSSAAIRHRPWPGGGPFSGSRTNKWRCRQIKRGPRHTGPLFRLHYLSNLATSCRQSHVTLSWRPHTRSWGPRAAAQKLFRSSSHPRQHAGRHPFGKPIHPPTPSSIHPPFRPGGP